MSTTTPNYGWILPGVGDPTDQDLWGGYLNSNLSDQDTVVKDISDVADDAYGPLAPPPESVITFTDITTNNASASKHGYLPKLSGSASDFLNGLGAWSTAGNFRQIKFASSATPVVGTGSYADLVTATLTSVQSGSYVVAFGFANFTCGSTGLFMTTMDITDNSNNSILVSPVQVGLSGNAGPAQTCGSAIANWTTPGTGSVTVKLRQNGSAANTAISYNILLLEYAP